MIKKIYSLKQKIIECRHRFGMTSKVIPIYMFHRVTDNIRAEYENISITPNAFENFITRKLGEGWKIIPINGIETKENFGEHAAVITFDDMYEDAFLYAVPILRKNNIPYTVFVAPNLIGEANYITKEEYEDLKKDELCTIGAHSLSHKILRKLSTEEKYFELDKKNHEEMLECAIDYFAFPYGSCYACDYESRRIVEKNYKYGFSTLNFPSSHKYLKWKPNFLPRINVNCKNHSRV